MDNLNLIRSFGCLFAIVCVSLFIFQQAEVGAEPADKETVAMPKSGDKMDEKTKSKTKDILASPPKDSRKKNPYYPADAR